MKPSPLLVATALACSDAPPTGTFVGNPSLSARIADNLVQQVTSGRLEALEIHVTECEAPPTPLGPRVLEFDGPASTETLPLPVGDHCGLFVVVDLFTVAFEDDGTPITIVADDFDLEVPAAFAATQGEAFVLRLGDEAWLAEVAALAPSGETQLPRGPSALGDAFFGGLVQGSTVLSFE
ncbi:MAG: hypothetical protein AAF602_02925 [Myxococcota bacterium]